MIRASRPPRVVAGLELLDLAEIASTTTPWTPSPTPSSLTYQRTYLGWGVFVLR